MHYKTTLYNNPKIPRSMSQRKFNGSINRRAVSLKFATSKEEAEYTVGFRIPAVRLNGATYNPEEQCAL